MRSIAVVLCLAGAPVSAFISNGVQLSSFINARSAVTSRYTGLYCTAATLSHATYGDGFVKKAHASTNFQLMFASSGAQHHSEQPAQLQKCKPTKAQQGHNFGGGTAGCVLANKLSADKSNNVLMLEAGTGKYDAKNIKVLGGSSCLNVMLYHRGTKQDYDNWNVPSWSSKDVLPYFKRAEGNRNLKASEYHNTDGPYSVEYVRYKNPLSTMFVDACKQAGLPLKQDFNDWSQPQEGFGPFQLCQKFGRRVSGERAVGIEYVQNGEKRAARIDAHGE
eukprot:2980-Heterococcus_DN1.PRE.1